MLLVEMGRSSPARSLPTSELVGADGASRACRGDRPPALRHEISRPWGRGTALRSPPEAQDAGDVAGGYADRGRSHANEQGRRPLPPELGPAFRSVNQPRWRC